MNPLTNNYSVQADWCGETIQLSLSTRNPEELDEIVSTAKLLWKNAEEWSQAVQDYAVEQLLPLKNDSWLGEGESEFTPDQFKGRMSLTGICVSPGGEFEFFHNDGDLFWGHAIHIGGSLNGGFEYADIPG